MARESKRLAEAVEDYLRYRSARYAPTTVEQDGYLLRRFVANIGDIQLRHLTAEHVSDWFYGPAGLMSQHRTRDGRIREAVKPSTHNYVRGRLVSLFAFCATRGWIKADLLAEVRPMKEVKRVRLQPPPDKLLALLDHANTPRDRCYIAILLNSGLRSNEVVRMRVGDVDLDGGWIHVVISKTAEEDSMPISADLHQELRAWLTTYAIDLGRPLDPEDHPLPARKGPRYQWVTVDGTKVRTQARATWISERPMAHPERVVKAALAALGLDQPGEGSHTLRRAPHHRPAAPRPAPAKEPADQPDTHEAQADRHGDHPALQPTGRSPTWPGVAVRTT